MSASRTLGLSDEPVLTRQLRRLDQVLALTPGSLRYGFWSRHVRWPTRRARRYRPSTSSSRAILGSLAVGRRLMTSSRHRRLPRRGDRRIDARGRRTQLAADGERRGSLKNAAASREHGADAGRLRGSRCPLLGRPRAPILWTADWSAPDAANLWTGDLDLRRRHRVSFTTEVYTRQSRLRRGDVLVSPGAGLTRRVHHGRGRRARSSIASQACARLVSGRARISIPISSPMVRHLARGRRQLRRHAGGAPSTSRVGSFGRSAGPTARDQRGVARRPGRQPCALEHGGAIRGQIDSSSNAARPSSPPP